MSMYTQLLEAAWKDRSSASERDADATPDADPPDDTLDEVVRRRQELDEGLRAGESAETVPAQLALQIGYDVALMDLAQHLGIETEPSCFEQPQQERERLERELRDKGVRLEGAAGGDRPVANHH